jgi:hypothetical protein
MREILITIIASLPFVIAIVSFLGIVIFTFRVIFHTKPGVRRWSRQLQYNPFNVVFRSELLTDNGLKDRRRLVFSLICFVGIIVLSFVIARIVHLLK